MKMAFIFQPYLVLMFLGCFATYGYLQYAENKYMALLGIAIILGNLFAYVKVLIAKTIVLRGVGNKLILTAMCICAGIGQGNYDLGQTSSIITAIALFTLLLMDTKYMSDILKDNKFVKDYNHKPDLSIFLEDLNVFNIFKSSKDRKIKFRDELYTYINNDVKFDNKGVKNTNITFTEIEKYIEESFSSINDFNSDSIKAIEMLKI